MMETIAEYEEMIKNVRDPNELKILEATLETLKN